ncbi:transketolase [sulfur-oxidizing endosymbiont of Gigantopelta aegis]|uniref:transketolase n=1 Tax=sulfur-oxidizing endosymbiont of Gigantopelta aegis TaxID=2794934 RepID=UPI0018DEA0C3|nr:transketolase [sulfur-oxidizing endosymbiont of Gigantopelta aegis]
MPERKVLANAIRALSMDAVQKANSGHPGAPMGMADIAEVLWNDFMNHNPANPDWTDRDRFILSNGHGSMLIYSLLHLTGYELSIDDLKQFRQLHSKTPGHPEYGYAPGIETTTGPLGQGITNGVGMALAEKTMAAQFNRDGHDIVDHYTYVFMGDGCMMEGISHESCALAGTWGLGKLIAYWDDNGISIDGHVEGWFTDDTPKRFESYGWHVIRDVDGHDADALRNATLEARSVTDRPTLICAKTVIGQGSPNLCGTHDCHGAPLGDDEIAKTRENIGWTHEPFVIPDDVYSGWDARSKGAEKETAWNEKFAAYTAAYPELAAEYTRRMASELPANWEATADAFVKKVADEAASIPSRKASQNSIEGYAGVLPEFLGGSADLSPSNLTTWSNSVSIMDDTAGNYISYGVREFGMSAIMNGVALHGGFLPYGATFLMFSEYARNALRMAALMKQRALFVYTHDSIGLGEDGPTHQPVEQIATLRMIPNMSVWRPADAVESAVAWRCAIEKADGPSCLIFSRQNLDHQARSDDAMANIAKGAYVLSDCEGTADVILMATGSEVGITVNAAKELTAKGKKVRVVSIPCTNSFEAQSAEYRESVLPAAVTARVAIEAGVTYSWGTYVGLNGKVIGLDRFGESAPASELFKEFGFTVENIVATAESVM